MNDALMKQHSIVMYFKSCVCGCVVVNFALMQLGNSVHFDVCI